MYPVMETNDRNEAPHPTDAAVVTAQQQILDTEEILLKTEIKQTNENNADMPTAPMYASSPYRNSEIEVNPLMTEEYMGATTVWELPRRVKIYRLLGLLMAFIPLYNLGIFFFNIFTIDHIFKAINHAVAFEGMDLIPFPPPGEMIKMKVHEPIMGIFFGMMVPLIGYKALKNGGSTRWLGCFNCCTCCSLFCSLFSLITTVMFLFIWMQWQEISPDCDAASICLTPLKSEHEVMQCIDGTSDSTTLPDVCEPLQPMFMNCEHNHPHPHEWDHTHFGHFHHHMHHPLRKVFKMVTGSHHHHHFIDDHPFPKEFHPHFHHFMLPKIDEPPTAPIPEPEEKWVKLDDEIEIEPAAREDRIVFHQLPMNQSKFEDEEPKLMLLMMPQARPTNVEEVNFTKPMSFGPGPADGPLEEEDFETIEDRLLQERPSPRRFPGRKEPRPFPGREEGPFPGREEGPFPGLEEGPFPPPGPPPVFLPHARPFLGRRGGFPPPPPHRRPHRPPPSEDPRCKLSKKGARYFHIYLIAQPEITYYITAILLLAALVYVIESVLMGCLFHHGRKIRRDLIADERCARELQDFNDDAHAEEEGNSRVVVASTGDGYDQGMYPMMENVQETHAARVTPLLQGQQTAIV